VPGAAGRFALLAGMPVEAKPLRIERAFSGDDGIPLDTACCYAQVGDQLLANSGYQGKVYSVEESWEQSQSDGSDSDLEHSFSRQQMNYPLPVSPLTLQIMRYPLPDARCPECTDQEQHANQSANSDAELKKERKKQIRPCKGRRDRFRKYIDHLKAKVRQELDTFDMDKVQIPSHMAPKGVARVRSMMEKYHQEVLQGVLPELDANTLRRSVRRSHKVPLHLAMYVPQ